MQFRTTLTDSASSSIRRTGPARCVRSRRRVTRVRKRLERDCEMAMVSLTFVGFTGTTMVIDRREFPAIGYESR